MAHMKQQIKRYKNDNRKHLENVSKKSALKTSIAKVLKAVEAGDKEAAMTLYNDCARQLDASVTHGLHHKNYASNQKSRLMKKINSL